MSSSEQPVRRPAPWVFLVFIVATSLAAGISLSMMAAPEMLSTHEGAGVVRFFLAFGAVYLGMPITWALGLSVIAMYPRATTFSVNKVTVSAAAVWTAILAVPYLLALTS